MSPSPSPLKESFMTLRVWYFPLETLADFFVEPEVRLDIMPKAVLAC